jgi:hypothetical protein
VSEVAVDEVGVRDLVVVGPGEVLLVDVATWMLRAHARRSESPCIHPRAGLSVVVVTQFVTHHGPNINNGLV